jgi:hypothetical protein
MTDVDRNTINSLLLRTGEQCAALLDERMRQLPCRRLQCDETRVVVRGPDWHPDFSILPLYHVRQPVIGGHNEHSQDLRSCIVGICTRSHNLLSQDR